MIHYGAQISSFMETPVDLSWPPIMLVEENSKAISRHSGNRVIIDQQCCLKLQNNGIAAHELHFRISLSIHKREK